MEKVKEGFPLSPREFWLLVSLAESPKHGYAIMKHVRELTNGKVDLSIGSLYENLAKLWDGGMIERYEDGDGNERRKVYRITALGARLLTEFRATVERVSKPILNPAL